MKTKHLAALAVTAVGVLVMGVGAPAFASVPATASPSAASTASGASDLVVKDSQVLGPIRQNPHVAGRDNGQSVLYQGKSLWFFDDTTLQNPDGFLSSTAAATSDLDASNGISLESSSPFTTQTGGTPGEFIPYSAAETAFQNAHASGTCTTASDPYCGTVFAFWPGATIADPANHRILVFYGKLCRGGADGTPCASGYVGQALGSGIASVNMDTHTVTRMTVQNQDPTLTSPEGRDRTLLFSPSENWGNGGAVLVGKTLYAYGECDSTVNCGVAKVDIDHVQNRLAWSFYAGTSNGKPVWSADSSAAVRVMQGGAAGETVDWDPAFHAYLDTYLPPYSTDAQYRTAPTPWGPWSDAQHLYTAGATTGVDYAGFAHPEYSTDHGLTKYFSYYDSATGAQDLVRVDFEHAG